MIGSKHTVHNEFAYALIYDDYSGLSDDEYLQLEEWTNEHKGLFTTTDDKVRTLVCEISNMKVIDDSDLVVIRSN